MDKMIMYSKETLQFGIHKYLTLKKLFPAADPRLGVGFEEF
jgi:hypothetical protein